jgi:hypothetical protein
MSRLRVPRRRGRPRTRPDVVLADKAYPSRAIRGHLRKRGIRAVIPVPADQQGHRPRRGSRGGRPPAFDRETYEPVQFNSAASSCDCLAHVYGDAADHPDRVRRYPSDMTDAEWAAIQPLLPVPAWLQGGCLYVFRQARCGVLGS